MKATALLLTGLAALVCAGCAAPPAQVAPRRCPGGPARCSLSFVRLFLIALLLGIGRRVGPATSAAALEEIAQMEELADLDRPHLRLIHQPSGHLVAVRRGANALGAEEQAQAEPLAHHDAEPARLGVHAGEEDAALAAARGAAQADDQHQAVGVAARRDEGVLGAHG